jgi:hypothetical protein
MIQGREKMQDKELRRLVLQRLYDIRQTKPVAGESDFADLSLEPNALGRALLQLKDDGLVSANVRRTVNGQYILFSASISVHGSRVIEGPDAPKPWLNLNPGAWGINIDLKELRNRIVNWWRSRRG